MAANIGIATGDPVFIDTDGFAHGFAAVAGRHIRGVALQSVANTGAAGAQSIQIEAGTFVFNNDTGSPLDFSDLGKLCYFKDKNTVKRNVVVDDHFRLAKPSGAPIMRAEGPSGTLVIAGTVQGFDADGRVQVTLGAASANSILPSLLPTITRTTAAFQSVHFYSDNTYTSNDTTPVVIGGSNGGYSSTGSRTLWTVTGSCQSSVDEDWVATFQLVQVTPSQSFDIMKICGNKAGQKVNGAGTITVTAPVNDYEWRIAFFREVGTGTITVNVNDWFTLGGSAS